IRYLHVPSGPGVRWDSGVETGSDVGLTYDPMLAKLIVWGEDRAHAVARMHRALEELVVDGVESSREFHLRVMEDDEFRRGDIEIQWLERRLPSIVGATASAEQVRTAAIAAALLADQERRARAGGSLAPVADVAGAAAAYANTPASSTSVSAWAERARREGLRR
ncbi:MAG: acetyl-CoA carboxylase biotin carboxylase subunit, partial [Gemmatimonadetes bacterium]|nr:acetyl-CoA carboxylase biotin carboxylase subunit [Gemmatimonadota bacterium]